MDETLAKPSLTLQAEDKLASVTVQAGNIKIIIGYSDSSENSFGERWSMRRAVELIDLLDDLSFFIVAKYEEEAA